jgi:hypothetical protein
MFTVNQRDFVLFRDGGGQPFTEFVDGLRLAIGDVVSLKEGTVGIVLARYIRSDNKGAVHYIVELRPAESARGRHRTSNT